MGSRRNGSTRRWNGSEPQGSGRARRRCSDTDERPTRRWPTPTTPKQGCRGERGLRFPGFPGIPVSPVGVGMAFKDPHGPGATMRVCLGGTFEPFHAGHEALLSAAANGAGEVFVGVTDGELAKREGRTVSPWPERAKHVESYLKGSGFKGRIVTRALTDPMGPAAK